MNARRFLPLLAFGALIAFLVAGLRLDPREVPSPLLSKPAPAFQLPQLRDPGLTFARDELKGQVWLLNVWASWCASCRAEHAVLVDFAKSGIAPLVGLNYRDNREDALAWLASAGDPYRISVMDANGRTGIDYGVYGTPETFVIDRAGIVRLRHVGPLSPETMNKKIIPAIKDLQRS